MPVSNPVRPTLLGVVVFVLLQAAVVLCGFPATYKLERAFPVNHRIEISQLRERDSLRHRRILKQSSSPSPSPSPSPPVVDFPVEGNYDHVGMYYTKVHLGSPPKEYLVQIDTGSDVLWVSCVGCNGCPTSSGLGTPISFYDPLDSPTSSPILCSDKRCSGRQSSDATCSNNQCGYTFQYADGSGASGYYVSDLMHLDMISTGPGASNTSASVVFGCSTTKSGILTKFEGAVDGIFGFGRQSLSVIAQLSSKGVAPNSFSHCLIGNDVISEGGTLVMGQIIEPNMVYTPLVKSQPLYNIDLESISVNGETLSIHKSTFAITDDQGGRIVDSGTTLAYLADGAYSPFVKAIWETVSQSVRPQNSKGNRCYLITKRVSDIFPTVGLHFAGGATMNLRPQDYLIQRNSVDGAENWCIGFQTNEGTTILGDLVLKDKVIVYDLGGQRIGWTDYDCASAVNISSTSIGGRSWVFNASQPASGTSLRITSYELISILFLASILHVVVMFGGFLL